MTSSAWTWITVTGLCCGASAAFASEPDLDAIDSAGHAWVGWQGRVSLSAASAPWRAWDDATALRRSTLNLMGDYYFASPWNDANLLGGFRASSGLIIGPRAGSSYVPSSGSFGGPISLVGRSISAGQGMQSVDFGDAATTPYLGLGYTGLSVRAGWSFTADLGMVAQVPGAASRSGRVLGVGQSLDEALRDLRLTPMLQLGANYAF